MRGPIVKNISQYNLGTMWECPDFFRSKDKYVLMFSPMNLEDKTTLYLLGTMDYNSGEFLIEEQKQLNYGFDFYAPQTLIKTAKE
ncbi:hypothetical protein [Bacillus cabrialesii]|uniref:hypothetical protein n=1 Tax=Bacillus cabrialesii TaxID=2487276 RepID=UPI0033059E9A